MIYAQRYINKIQQVIKNIDCAAIEKMVLVLKGTRMAKGRLFIIGSGGGAGFASHAVCDFRKLCSMEAYCPTDNVTELTARINDEGWDNCLAHSLKASNLKKNDCVLVFSVGGGSEKKNISVNLVNAIKYAKKIGAKVLGIVGRDGGYTAKVADACVIIPPIETTLVTPYTESLQAMIWHLIVTHPDLKMNPGKWESLRRKARHA